MATWWDNVCSTVQQEFSDFANTEQVIPLILRLLLAIALGGILGFQRERTGRAAGLRTHMLVSMGAALFVLIPRLTGMPDSEEGRIIQGVVTGIGFIGGGAILKLTADKQVKGVTTAASIWLTTAVGIAVGLGRHWTAVIGALLALFVLSALVSLEHWIDGHHVNPQ